MKDPLDKLIELLGENAVLVVAIAVICVALVLTGVR